MQEGGGRREGKVSVGGGDVGCRFGSAGVSE